MKTRIDINDNVMGMVMKMSGGNPGALTVLMRLVKEAEAIDPDAILGGIGAVLALDSLGIYESQIWMLYKDICGQDMVTMLGLMRGVQLGFMSRSELTNPLNESYALVPQDRIEEVLAQVRERLPAFGK